ncbi:Rieske 2Fe-2S domain-containing protein [Streptomyces sp. NPDC001719]
MSSSAKSPFSRVRDYRPAPGDTTANGLPALPYPSGWFCLGFSAEIPPGTVLTRPFMGEDIVIYRTRGGALHAVRPYCPHLGAHLGVGGTIDGENLVCPFHRYAFGPDGTCVGTPHGSPPRAHLENHTVQERNGIIFVWFGHGGALPSWQIPALPDAGFTPPVHRAFELASHPQEIMENTVDYSHHIELHGFANWEETAPPQTEGPLLHVNLRIGFGRFPLLGNIAVDQPVLLAGLGWFLVELDFPRYNFATRVWALPSPIAPWRVCFRIAVSSAVRAGTGRLSRPLPEPVARCLSRAAAQVLLQWTVRAASDDLPIWNHKRYESRPRLIKGEGPIGPYRRWARQFYPPAASAPIAAGNDQRSVPGEPDSGFPGQTARPTPAVRRTGPDEEGAW